LKVNEILEIAYYWLSGCQYNSILKMTGHSSKTLVAMLGYFRQLITDNLDLEDSVIGGQDIIVEIDEAKFGKRKYHVGHKVDGAWVLGGVERTTERKIFLIQVPDRREKTLLNFISQHVRAGSIIHTDCFKAYFNLGNTFEHLKVNHSRNFRDPITGCHTNTIEGTWNGIKMKISPRARTKGLIDEHLAEFVWRRKHSQDMWQGFIEALQETIYIQ
jgi:transposase-like protein